MDSIKITVTGNQAVVAQKAVLVSGTVGLSVEFAFDDAWEDLNKTAVFRANGKSLDVLNVTDAVTVPWELLKNPGCRMWAGVYGTNADGSLQIPTVWADLGIIQPGADPSGDESADPSLPVWAQVHKETVRYTPQTLTEKQRAQARKNIGAAAIGSGGGSADAVVIVTISEDGKASMTSEQIYSSVMNCDTVYLLYESMYIPIFLVTESVVCFSLWESNTHRRYQIDEQGTIEIYDYECLSKEFLFEYFENSFKTTESTKNKASYIDDNYGSQMSYPTTQAVIDYVTGYVGNIEAALDSIIAIQESLIGGNGQ